MISFYRRAVAAIAAHAMQFGLVEDETFNVLTGGNADQTFSLRNADEAKANVPVACWVCWNLSWMVQKDHCALTLRNGSIPWPNAIRASFFISLFMIGFPCAFLRWGWPVAVIFGAVLAVDIAAYRFTKPKESSHASP